MVGNVVYGRYSLNVYVFTVTGTHNFSNLTIKAIISIAQQQTLGQSIKNNQIRKVNYINIILRIIL